MISFHLPITPGTATSQSAGKRIIVIKGRPRFFKNKAAKAAETALASLVAQYRPEKPIEGPIRLSVEFCFPWRKSERKSTIALGRVPHTVRPDASNMIKMIEDTLTRAGFWIDDGQVAVLRVAKAWGDNVGITVQIEEIGKEEADGMAQP